MIKSKIPFIWHFHSYLPSANLLLVSNRFRVCDQIPTNQPTKGCFDFSMLSFSQKISFGWCSSMSLTVCIRKVHDNGCPKALRLIKYVVGKSGVEFRREMQRHSMAIRQLTHYKGQLDPLKGDSLNKVVRDTTNETVAIIFSSDDNKPAPSEDLNRRIQGFGNTNFEMAPEVPKSFLSEVVGIGSATIKQGLISFNQSPSMKKNDTGSYRSPNLRRSLTTENESVDRSI